MKGEMRGRSEKVGVSDSVVGQESIKSVEGQCESDKEQEKKDQVRE